MSSTVLYMSMSLDGFIAGPNAAIDNGLGDNGERLHHWIDGGQNLDKLDGADKEVADDFMTTGAVIAGRGTFEPAGGWGGDHHDGVPIFIISRHEPAPEFAGPLVTYLADVDAAVRQAKAAAGDKNVLVHGAAIAQSMLRSDLLDEIQIHLIPVLLGGGRPLFEHLGTDHIELETVDVARGKEATHLRYRVVKG
jgi:dihydrofolate reductase